MTATYKPTYDLYRTKAEAEARVAKLRRAGFVAKVLRVTRAAGNGSSTLITKYTVDYREKATR